MPEWIHVTASSNSNIIDWKISYRSHCLHIVKEFGGFFHELAGLEICT